MGNLNLQYFLFIFTLLSAGLFWALMIQLGRNRLLARQLENFRGQSDAEVYDRWKFYELGLMTAGIMHEISNPLSIIMFRVSNLLKSKDTHQVKSLEQIMSSAERISSTIQNVRGYIYREDEKVEDFISLREILDSVLVFYGQRLKNHGIELYLKDIDHVYISGHKGQYEQALLNLVGNSFDAVDHLTEKWIEIRAIKTVNTVDIFITDSGAGIPIDMRSKILEPFYTSKNGKGAGLGLSLVKDIARKHGGDLRYIEGPHTTFVLELPQTNPTKYHV
jgi:signal transduction histidine kinase